MFSKPQTFTAEGPGIQNVILTPAQIRPAFDPSTTPDKWPSGCPVQAIWDTGAQGSVITARVVQKCGLKPTGMRRVRGVHGEALTPVFLVNLEIPPNVGFPAIAVTQGDLGDDTDLLIGMDIINRGDFAITNHQGKTVFSFRFPSMQRIDFITDAKSRQTLLTAGRNDPCPCGSNKKFKKCCGKPT